jgi:hypothetical protein
MGMASGGLTALPIPDNMFDEQQYGGGGIVAFSGKEGSDVKLTDEMLIKVIQDPRAPAEERAAARQELQERRGPVSDYGTPRTAEDTRAAFAEGLPQGLAQVGGALGQGFMNSEFAQDMSTIPAGIKDYLNSDSAARAATAITAPVKGYMDASRWMLGMPAPTPDAAAAPVPVIETTAAPSRAPLNAPTKEGYLGDAGPNIRNDRMLADILAKNAAAPVSPDAAEKAAAEKVTAPRGPRVDPVDPEAAKAVADVAEAAPGVPKIDYLEALAKYRGEAPTLTAGESLADQKKQDFWSTIAQMGFGAAAGTSPNALANFSAGAAGAMPGMQKAMDRRRETQRDAAKAEDARKLAIFVSKGEDFRGSTDAGQKDAALSLNREQFAETSRQNIAENLLRQAQIDVSAAGVAAQGTSEAERMFAKIDAMPEGREKDRAIANWEAVKGAGAIQYDPRKAQTQTQLDIDQKTIDTLQGTKRIVGSLTKAQQDDLDAAMRRVYGGLAAAPAAGNFPGFSARLKT